MHRILNSTVIRATYRRRPLWERQAVQLAALILALAAMLWLVNNPKPGEPSWYSAEAELETWK